MAQSLRFLVSAITVTPLQKKQGISPWLFFLVCWVQVTSAWSVQVVIWLLSHWVSEVVIAGLCSYKYSGVLLVQLLSRLTARQYSLNPTYAPTLLSVNTKVQPQVIYIDSMIYFMIST